jgi:DNA replication protein DnaC
MGEQTSMRITQADLMKSQKAIMDKMTDFQKTAHMKSLEKRLRSIVPARFQNNKPRAVSISSEGLFLHGVTGCGKTYTAVEYFFKWCMDFGSCVNCMFWETPELIDAMRQESGEKTEHSTENAQEVKMPRRIMERCCTAPILVLDDLGSEKLTDWGIERITLLINHRYNELRPTIVTSNLTIDEIKRSISQRIGSRLSVLQFMEINEDDRRKA